MPHCKYTACKISIVYKWQQITHLASFYCCFPHLLPDSFLSSEFTFLKPSSAPAEVSTFGQAIPPGMGKGKLEGCLLDPTISVGKNQVSDRLVWTIHVIFIQWTQYLQERWQPSTLQSYCSLYNQISSEREAVSSCEPWQYIHWITNTPEINRCTLFTYYCIFRK